MLRIASLELEQRISSGDLNYTAVFSQRKSINDFIATSMGATFDFIIFVKQIQKHLAPLIAYKL